MADTTQSARAPRLSEDEIRALSIEDVRAAGRGPRRYFMPDISAFVRYLPAFGRDPEEYYPSVGLEHDISRRTCPIASRSSHRD